MKTIIFNKTESFIGRNTSDHACQICCSKSICETMYHWFFLLKITVAKIMNNLNVFSAHSYLYPRSRFKGNLYIIITVYKGQPHPPSMNSAYNFNLYIRAHFSICLEWFLYTCLTVLYCCILLHKLPTEIRQNISYQEDMYTFMDTPMMNAKSIFSF